MVKKISCSRYDEQTRNQTLTELFSFRANRLQTFGIKNTRRIKPMEN